VTEFQANIIIFLLAGIWTAILFFKKAPKS